MCSIWFRKVSVMERLVYLLTVARRKNNETRLLKFKGFKINMKQFYANYYLLKKRETDTKHRRKISDDFCEVA